MDRSDLYPEAPHLSAGLYTEYGERALFSRVCVALIAAGAEPTGVIGVAPRARGFKMVSDLGADYQELGLKPDRLLAIASDANPGQRAIRMGFRRKPSGLIVVGYDFADRDDDHAVSLLTAARSLGVPQELQSGAELRRARKRGCDFVDLVRRIIVDADPLYGEIGVEISTPTPHTLMKDTETLLPGDLFVSDRLLADAPALRSGLLACFSEGAVSSWENGLHLSCWGMLNDRGVTIPESMGVPRKAARLLGRALAHRR
ncbi:hypothetical protein ABZU32_22380 [Sphaerisporangium sp. NPDC005288]|uniref:hypothetical protein n=1 Tax=Sphaerisporangium sp. NPDC005288 TaxID=3155114 RepID=UPI0033B6BDE1